MVLVTFVLVALFIPVEKKIAEFIGAMDIPNARKVQRFLFLDWEALVYMLAFY